MAFHILPKGVFFKCFPVPHVRVPCRFEVMVLHEALDGTDADRGGDECCFHKMLMDLGGVQPRESLLEPVDLFDGCSWATEATAIGNLAVQMIGAGVYGNLKEAREGIFRSFDIKKYEPQV